MCLSVTYIGTYVLLDMLPFSEPRARGRTSRTGRCSSCRSSSYTCHTRGTLWLVLGIRTRTDISDDLQLGGEYRGYLNTSLP